ncbi:MAG: type III pantothenate kinase [Pseudomonadales bacterium]|nr:type III pantothenate kinase [Anaerolineales bacterium]MCB8917107.1 type III pantothenate kinase [Ardenticatenaceae bacterium]MCP5190534.1 type III pantothenate kinase [Pseudomonadales bacterium]
MLLAIDIGNTNITLGLWDGSAWQLQWRLRTIHDQTVDEYGIYLKMLLREVNLANAIDRVILSSVVPALTSTFADVCERYLKQTALLVRPDTDTGIRIATDNPAEVGADRIVNTVAAYQQYGGPTIVVDMGTATTLDAISADGALLGVIIFPGMKLTADALASRAAQLSRVALEAPPHVLGRNTIHAVQSGLVFGYASLVEGLVQRLRAELDVPQATVVGTGGLIRLIQPHTPVIDYVDPWLTLTGLRLISERIRGR